MFNISIFLNCVNIDLNSLALSMATVAQSTSYDAIVVGAGVEGSATAMWLARKGVKTLLLEQFELGHTRGSSHGGSRIIRYNYPEAFYVEMMKSAYPMWADIERETQMKLVEKCGGIAFGRKDFTEMVSVVSSLRKNDIPHQIFKVDEIKTRFPFLNLPDDFIAVYDSEAGFLYARRCVLAMQKLFLSYGGTILDRHKVLGITPGKRIEVESENGSFYCNSLILCTGAWTNKVLAGTNLKLPLSTNRVCVTFWEKTDPIFDNKHIFIYRAFNDPGNHYYGMPDSEYPGLFKICAHSGTISDPDHRDMENEYSVIPYTTRFIKTKLKGVADKPSIIETCLYTVTPDNNPFLDRHPQYPNIIIGAGFSGHGFKLAPVVGSILSGLVLGEHIPFDMSRFKIGRFTLRAKL